MDKFIIEGGTPLQGEITPAGNKNAALPLLAACLLTEEPVILHNVPDIRDVQAMRALLVSLGVKMDDLGSHSWRLTSKNIRSAIWTRRNAARSAPRSCSPVRCWRAAAIYSSRRPAAM